MVAAADTSSQRLVAVRTQHPYEQVRCMSAAGPGSVDDKKDEPKPEPGGFLSKLMSKENCVVSSQQKKVRIYVEQSESMSDQNVMIVR